MKLICCVDQNWGLGKNNHLLFNIPEDMKRFRQETAGKVVVMGAATFKSLPNGPLKGRTNIVLDHTGEAHEGATTVTSLYKLSQELVSYDTSEVLIIGGASVYEMMLPFCEEALVTKVFADGDADRFFPNIDENPHFKLVYEGDRLKSVSGLDYQFLTYRDINEVNSESI